MRTEQEMYDLILRTAKEDERIRAALLVGSRADPEAPRDQYQDYDITCLVKDVTPFYNNLAWIEETFGKPAVLQMPELMSHPLLPPESDGHFAYLMIFDDGVRIDLNIGTKPYMTEGEPAAVLLDKDGIFANLRPQKGYWHIQPPNERIFLDCCNEFWWCLNNVAKGIARDELPYAMEMFHHYVRDMLNEMLKWEIGVRTGFSVSAGKMGKYFKKYLPEERYRLYEKTYSDSDYEHVWDSVFTACELFRTAAQKVSRHFGFSYRTQEDQNMTAYLTRVRQQSKKETQD